MERVDADRVKLRDPLRESDRADSPWAPAAASHEVVRDLRLHEIELEMQNEELLLHKLELELQNEELRGFHQELDATWKQIDTLVAERTRELERKLRQLAAEARARSQSETALRLAYEELERLKNRLQAENAYLLQEAERYRGTDVQPSETLLLDRLKPQIDRAAAGNHPVLVTGEVGVGKKGVIWAIHQRGARRHRPLVTVNCTLPAVELLECQLLGRDQDFGKEVWAPWQGRLQLAEQGDLFMEEAGALPKDLRNQLVDIARKGQFQPQGSARTVPLSARILCTTIRDLDEERRTGRVEEGLIEDLNMQVLQVPPLRERREDIPALARIFVAWFNRMYGKAVEHIPEAVLGGWMQRDWPCNVRELRHTVERAVVRSTGTTLEP